MGSFVGEFTSCLSTENDSGPYLRYHLVHDASWKTHLPGRDILEVVREQLNESTATVKGTRRTYIYSEEDDVIGWEDVEDHARDAERKGWAVELVKFQTSTHVGHLKQDPERYREVILKTWFGRST